VSAAIGVYLAALEIDTEDYREFCARFHEAKEYLAQARPTAVNLFWALDRMENVVLKHPDMSVAGICDLLKAEAVSIRKEDIEVCRRIGEFGLSLVKPGDGLLTHCNAGRLAAVRYGTATAPIYLGHEKGYDFRVFADETRPLLQGARLTAYELNEEGIDVTLICDNMAGSVMRRGWVNAVFVGCDRVAANGDFANKIGTAMLAVAAARYRVPFYVCAPTSTIDLAAPDGQSIHIEERPAHEVTDMWYKEPMTSPGVKVYNPAFDVTDNDLITAIITEHGIARPPFTESLRKMKEQKT
jgi:methylthioribose-1-phosphate isomerase